MSELRYFGNAWRIAQIWKCLGPVLRNFGNAWTAQFWPYLNCAILEMLELRNFGNVWIVQFWKYVKCASLEMSEVHKFGNAWAAKFNFGNSNTWTAQFWKHLNVNFAISFIFGNAQLTNWILENPQSLIKINRIGVGTDAENPSKLSESSCCWTSRAKNPSKFNWFIVSLSRTGPGGEKRARKIPQNWAELVLKHCKRGSPNWCWNWRNGVRKIPHYIFGRMVLNQTCGKPLKIQSP